MNDIPLIIIIIIVFVVILSVMFTWSYNVKKAAVIPTLTSYSKSNFGMRCSVDPITEAEVKNFPGAYFPQECDTDFKCIKAYPTDEWGYCRKKLGTLCNSIYECEPTAISCSKVCTNGVNGSVNQQCYYDGSCNFGLSCISGTCKINDTFTGCSQGSDCVSGRCALDTTTSLYTCKTHLDSGDQCNPSAVDPTPCGSGQNCVQTSSSFGNHFCQPTGIFTGDVGSICYYPRGPYYYSSSLTNTPQCNVGVTCGYDYALGGPVSGEQYGYCSSDLSSFGQVCTSSGGLSGKSCHYPLICENGLCVMPKDLNGLENLNYAGNGTSYTCNIGTYIGFDENSLDNCLSAPNVVCGSHSHCFYGNCGGGWRISKWVFSDSPDGVGNWTKLGFNIATAPGLGSCFTTYQNGSITRFLYYSGSGSSSFYCYTLNGVTESTYTGTIQSGTSTLVAVKSVKISAAGNLLIHATVTTALYTPLTPGNPEPIPPDTSNQTYDRVFVSSFDPSTAPSTISLSDTVGPYFNGLTSVPSFDFYDFEDVSYDAEYIGRFAFGSVYSATIYSNKFTNSSPSIVTQMNAFYDIQGTISLPGWSTPSSSSVSNQGLWLKFYTSTDATDSKFRLLYLLKAKSEIKSIDGTYTYPQVNPSLIYGIAISLSTINTIANPHFYITNSESMVGLPINTSPASNYISIGSPTSRLILPGYSSPITDYGSTNQDDFPTSNLISQGSIDLSLYTLNKVCSQI